MVEAGMRQQMAAKDGFIAALDQSGGSTPGALRQYGVPDDAYKGEAEMFALVHAMRVRIMTAPAFTGAKVLAAILFEVTMDGEAKGQPVPTYLWKERGVVPILKVDKGLAAEADGVALMKPMPDLASLLDRAVAKGVFGTKMRSVIHRASKNGVAAIVAQQFDLAKQIAGHGLVPIVEPEVSIKAPDKAECETLLRDAILVAARRPAEGRRGDAEADDSDVAGFLRAVDQAPEGAARRSSVGRLHARRGLPAIAREPRHDRELFARAGGRPQAIDDGR